MREILFRGKRTDNRQWIYGNYCYAELMDKSGYEDLIIEQPADGETRKIIPETVGQYTGLTDKNGNKIFEGDILEFSDRMVTVFWHAYLGCWDSNFLKFTNKENRREDMSPRHWSYRAKVVGNIHDNPELL